MTIIHNLGPPALNGLVSGEALSCQAQRVVFWAWAEYTSMARLRRRAQGNFISVTL
jgi:hypothetical protein